MRKDSVLVRVKVGFDHPDTNTSQRYTTGVGPEREGDIISQSVE